jgi:hypothetical protein
MDEEPKETPVVHTNGYHDKTSPGPLQITFTSVVKVQNGEVTKHGKGTDTDSEFQ